jgi:hypothetical protein
LEAKIAMFGVVGDVRKRVFFCWSCGNMWLARGDYAFMSLIISQVVFVRLWTEYPCLVCTSMLQWLSSLWW